MMQVELLVRPISHRFQELFFLKLYIENLQVHARKWLVYQHSRLVHSQAIYCRKLR